MKLKVTEKHIREGVKGDPSCCPIAKAILEQYPEYHEVRVGMYSVELIQKGVTVNEIYHPDLEDFVDSFDMGEQVEPFEVDFRPAGYRGCLKCLMFG
jgi:hypothetical protein